MGYRVYRLLVSVNYDSKDYSEANYRKKQKSW